MVIYGIYNNSRLGSLFATQNDNKSSTSLKYVQKRRPGSSSSSLGNESSTINTTTTTTTTATATLNNTSSNVSSSATPTVLHATAVHLYQ